MRQVAKFNNETHKLPKVSTSPRATSPARFNWKWSPVGRQSVNNFRWLVGCVFLCLFAFASWCWLSKLAPSLLWSLTLSPESSESSASPIKILYPKVDTFWGPGSMAIHPSNLHFCDSLAFIHYVSCGKETKKVPRNYKHIFGCKSSLDDINQDARCPRVGQLEMNTLHRTLSGSYAQSIKYFSWLGYSNTHVSSTASFISPISCTLYP